jgi:hypothetical protein
MARQNKIFVPKQTLPDPRDYDCEWCGEQATQRHERKAGAKHLGTQQFVFTCDAHAEHAMKALEKKPRQPRI